MTPVDLTLAALVGALYAAGFHLMLQRSLMRAVLGFVLLGHGTNLLLLASGGAPGAPPVADGGAAPPGTASDPLPQAMALTSIVITFGLTTFLVALAYRSWLLSGHDEVRDDVEDRRIGSAAERAPSAVHRAETSPPHGTAGDGGRPGGEWP
ncbi:NADH-quinone oxidoreductase subunit K [Streptomyces sp. CC228A]|uniref:sodium:proton antiporter n=1 Tax=Streptomyces sp. CC228A TaxID=2898186 RepID=UPI001F450061|nr:NADH-quinone oxidoreductase subunit K [Streptomyces sp. CC228A]